MSTTFNLEAAHQLRPTPTYMVVLNEAKKGNTNNFIATKLDETTHFVKCVGFFTNASTDLITRDYRRLIEEQPKEQVVEVMFPWARIAYIQSLIYQHKAK